jgi:hypothetical protein
LSIFSEVKIFVWNKRSVKIIMEKGFARA